MIDSSATIARFLAATAAKQPTPGGGSAAALTGALSAAIGEMCLNYSIGRKDTAEHEDQLRAAAAELKRARELMLELMVEDQLAYEAFSELRKLPQEAPERAEKLPAALLACIRAPQAMAAGGVGILQICDRVLSMVNPYLLSDWAVCGELAMAATRSASHNVRVNLAELEDAADRESIDRSAAEVLSHASVLIQRIVPRIAARREQRS